MIPQQHDPHTVADSADRLAQLAGVGPGLWDDGKLSDVHLVTIPGAEATGDDVCGESRDYWYCSREPGHPGRHLACLYRDAVIAAWPGDHQPTVADLADPAAWWRGTILGDWWQDEQDPLSGDIESCGEKRGGLLCTRREGHPGRHIATIGTGTCALAAWPGTHEPTMADLGTGSGDAHH